NALNGLNRRVQVYTSSRECTSVFGHLGEVVDGHISVMVQLIKSCINLIDGCAFTLNIRQNCLNGTDLSLVFLQTRLNRIYRKSRYKGFAKTHRTTSNVRNDRCSNYVESLKTHGDGINTIRNGSKIEL